jgi:hypothetical protein
VNAHEIEAAVATWEQRVEEHETKVIAAAELCGEMPVIDLVEVLADCPRPVLYALMERRRARSPEAQDRLRRKYHEKWKQVEAAERLAEMLDEKGKTEQAATQRARAAAIRAEIDLTAVPS